MLLAFLILTGMIGLIIRLVQYWRDRLEELFFFFAAKSKF